MHLFNGQFTNHLLLKWELYNFSWWHFSGASHIGQTTLAVIRWLSNCLFRGHLDVLAANAGFVHIAYFCIVLLILGLWQSRLGDSEELLHFLNLSKLQQPNFIILHWCYGLKHSLVMILDEILRFLSVKHKIFSLFWTPFLTCL